MTTKYTFAHPKHKIAPTSFYFTLRRLFTIVLLIGFCFMGLAQKKNKKNKKKQDITISSCYQDMTNGMYRVNFSYNNPNDEIITVAKGLSKLVIKKGNKRTTTFAINRFLPGEVENAFFVDFYEMEFVEWTLKNPGGETKKSKASSDSDLCPPPLIIPVYGQEGGKSETQLGLELTSLAEGNAGDEPSQIVYQITGTGNAREVLLEIVPKMGMKSVLRDILVNTFGRQYLANDPLNTDFIVDPALVVNGDLATFDVFFPINRLLELNNVASINFIRPLYTPVLEKIGRVSTQGDGAMLTDAVRESFVLTRDEDGTPLTYVDGEGIKIGVISDSFDKQPASEGQSKATADVGNKDLPGMAGIGNPDYPTPVDVRKDYPYGVASDEGRAMMHIIHDVAPGAELAFSTGVLSPRDFALAIEDLADAGCDLIVDDVTYPFEPFFGEGQISEAIRAFTNGEGNEGHAYFTSAGNFANRGYQGVFKASTLSPVTNIEALDDASAHVFNYIDEPGPEPEDEDIFQGISVVPGTYMIVLQWAEPLASQDNTTGATTDLDIFLVDDDGNFIVGNNRVNINGDAAEVLVFQATGTGTANILITSPTDPTDGGIIDIPFRYIAFRTSSDAGLPDGLQFTEYNGGAPTVSGHAMTLEARTVGAVFYQNALNPSAQPFSSFAGPLTNNQSTEVDFSAPDGGNTNVGSIGQQISDGDGFPNFFGTSAAAPHAAAAFALLQSAVSTWYPEGGLPIEVDVTTNLIADQVLQLFKNSAIPAGSLETAGSGLINAEAAFQQIAAQTAVITGFVIVEGQEEPTPGVDTYDVTISGKYIPAGATVFLGNEQLGIVGEIADTQITATVVPFTGNPELTVFTNSQLPGAGSSNGLNILPDGKIAINIIADDIDIEFGQDYELTYSVEGLPGEMTYEDTGLPELVLTSAAIAPFPDVDDYTIFIDFVDGERTEAELAALDTYQVNFIVGDFIVTKKDLLIQPLDATITYGDPVDVILNYEYDTEGISPENNAAFLNVIETAHDQDFKEDNTLILINRFRAVVNEVDILGLLNQGSWIASDSTINNRFRAVVNGMDLVDLDISHFTDYNAAEIDPITNRFRAVVNRFRAVVNSTDLFGNQVDFDFGSEVPELNRFRAVVNGTTLGDENDLNDYNKVFAIIDEEDAPTEEVPDREISQFYALNLLSGLDVTTGEDGRHYIFPGGLLNGLGSNFNVTYGAGRLSVGSTDLFVETPNLEVDFGMPITREYINSLISPVPVEGCEVCPASLVFEGFEYDDTVETVFADPTCDPEELSEGEVCAIVIPYYFEDIDTFEKYYIEDAGEEGLLLPVGRYFIKISDTKNYELDFGEGIGRLEVINREYTVSGNYDGDYPVEYGDFVFPIDISPFVKIFKTVEDEVLEELDEGEIEALFPSGIQYYLVDEELDGTDGEVRYILNDEEPPLLPYVGRYIVKISLPDESNFTLIYLDPLYVMVEPKTLLIEIQQSGPVLYGESTVGVSYSTFIDGLVGGDTQGTIFPGGIPNYFEDVNDEEVPRTRIELGDPLNVGEYFMRVEKPENYLIVYGEGHGTLTIDKATLFACIADVEIRTGETLFPDDIVLQGITGFAYGEDLDDVFPIDEAGDYIITYLVNGVPLTEDGLLLEGEITYTITINDEDLLNYTVEPGTTCSGTGRVNVTDCGDALRLDFSNYTFDELFEYYRFASVAPGLDALVTIQTRGTVGNLLIDNNDFNPMTETEDRKQFRPSASFTRTDAVPEPYVEFTITLVNAGTNTPATNVGELIAGVLDVDGDNNYQEYVEINLPSEYTVETVEGVPGPTDFAVIEKPEDGILRINGASYSNIGAFNGDPTVNVEVTYENVSCLIYRVGAKSSQTNVPTRQYGIQFECLKNFVLPVTEEVDLESAGVMAETTPENNCVVYNNPVGPGNGYNLELIPKDGVSGEASVTLFNIDTLESVTFNYGSISEGVPVEIDMSSFEAGLYIVQTNISNCVSDGFIVIRKE